MSYQNFYELDVYIKCREFRKTVESLVKTSIPNKEKYLLISQITDSARSITATIAEGHGRFHYQENIQFCRIARGSLSETLEHLICAFDNNYISKEILQQMKSQYDICLKSLNGYIAYLKRKKNE